MSYQVLARKWRPSLFEEVVGQEHVVRTLTNAVSSGRIGHAYLFSGPRGVGKTTVARILAKCLNCVNGPVAVPCNQCELCRGISGGSSVDVLEIDGASNTSVENVRELRESVRYAPAQGRYKVYIIDEVHMLSDSAFNALLKTLEEPPPHVVFVFATTEPHKIPATIHSRCQRFDFKRIPFKLIYAHLAGIAADEGVRVEDEAIYLIARESEGSLRDGQSLLEQVISFSGKDVKRSDVIDALGVMDRSVVFDLAGAVLEKDAAGCLNIVEKVHDFGYDSKKVLTELLELVRDLVVVKVSGDGPEGLPDQELERLKSLAAPAGVERLEMLFSVLTRGYEEVIRSSTPRFSFEMTLVRASRLDDVRAIGELIAGLEGLRRSGGGGSVPAGAKPGPAQSARRETGAAAVGRAPKAKPSAGMPGRATEARGGGDATDAGEAPYGPGEEGGAQEAAAAAPGGSVKGFLETVKKTDRAIFKALEAADISLDGASLVITVDADKVNFLKHMKKDDLDSIAGAYFKEKVTVSIEKTSGGGGADEGQPQASGGRQAASDPVLRQALTTLGGRVIR